MHFAGTSRRARTCAASRKSSIVTAPSLTTPFSSSSARMTPSSKPQLVAGVVYTSCGLPDSRKATFEMVVSVTSREELYRRTSKGGSAGSLEGCRVAPAELDTSVFAGRFLQRLYRACAHLFAAAPRRRPLSGSSCTAGMAPRTQWVGRRGRVGRGLQGEDHQRQHGDGAEECGRTRRHGCQGKGLRAWFSGRKYGKAYLCGVRGDQHDHRIERRRKRRNGPASLPPSRPPLPPLPLVPARPPALSHLAWMLRHTSSREARERRRRAHPGVAGDGGRAARRARLGGRASTSEPSSE